jgi:hypothetical protein
MNGSRALTRTLMAGGIAAVAVIGFAPTMSFAAANTDTLTVAGGSTYLYQFNQSPSIDAVAQPNCAVLAGAGTATLSISGPGVVDSTLASHKASCSSAVALSPSASSVNTAHPGWAGGSVAADNGVYTVTLNNNGRTKTASFSLLIPPAKPQDFSATADGGTLATFSWDANSEPDITGYQISDSSGSVVATATPDACSGGACTTGPTPLGSSVSGQTEHFSIAALRSCGTASCAAGHVTGASSAASSATFPNTAPTPTPTPTKSSGGSKSGGSGSSGGSGNAGSLGGGGNSGSGKSHSSGGSITVNLGQAGKSGTVNNSLPPVSTGGLSSVTVPSLPGIKTSIKPLDPGGKPTKINYPKPLLAQKNAADTGIAHDIKSGLTGAPLWRGIAAAAVLILIAVHLRAWVARTEASWS